MLQPVRVMAVPPSIPLGLCEHGQQIDQHDDGDDAAE
jgi:hypothetical protein